MNKLRVGLCQMLVSDDKENNLIKAEQMISRAAYNGARLVVLPEMFNCPYNNKYFPRFAEHVSDRKTVRFLSRLAKEKNIYLIGGSIPEKDDYGNIYNTSYIFDKQGNIIGKHRKIHLFDIDVKGKIRFKESDILNQGHDINVFDTEYGKMSVAICYDIRFPELIRLMSLEGSKIIIIPAAFNMTTGPAHWELLFRSRALDNQVYMIGCSPARDENSSYVAYGNSIIADPWGTIIGRLDDKEDVLIKDLDFEYLEKVREELPLLKHRRTDIYELNKK